MLSFDEYNSKLDLLQCKSEEIRRKMNYRKIVLGDMASADMCRSAPGEKYQSDPVFNELKLALNQTEDTIQHLQRFGDLPASYDQIDLME